MPTVLLWVPDTEQRGELQVALGEAILIGRRPMPSALPEDVHEALLGLRLRVHAVPSPRVSLNHLVLRYDERGIFVLDLQSRNGSWQKTPSTHWSFLAKEPTGFLELAVTSAWFATPAQSAIPKPTWHMPTEYPHAVAASIRRWLHQQGIPAVVSLQSQAHSDERGDSFTLPLQNGSLLQLEWPQHTTQERSLAQMQEQIASYVHSENQRFSVLSDHEEGVVLASTQIRAAHERVVEAAQQGQRLVLIGPTGCGKEVLAHCLHRHSVRKGRPFVAVNCAQLREDLLYAQMFGAKKGAFTGAVSDLPGLVETAHGGTLFLDELAEMDASTQRALLRFLDRRGEYLRLGDVRPRYADVQIVCATSVDLASEPLRTRGFREDLWYRLAVRVVHIAGLQHRPEDVVAILRSRKFRGFSTTVFEAMTPAALDRVLAETWPGNFRDLENFLQRLPVACRPGSIDEALVERALSEGRSSPQSATRTVPLESIAQPRSPKVVPLDKQTWSEVVHEAVDHFLIDNAGPPRGWVQLQSFTERYLKPIFVARSTGLWQSVELPETMNYSRLARQLGVSDGTTIKSHLQRYVSLLEESVTKRARPAEQTWTFRTK